MQALEEATPSSGTDVVQALRVVGVVCLDMDCALEFGMRGGHAALSKLLTRSMSWAGPATPEGDEWGDLVGDAIGVCTAGLPAGYSFPMPPSLPDAYDVRPSTFTFTMSASPQHEKGTDTTQLVLRHEWAKRMESQADVGMVLWPAAEIMGRWLAAELAPTWCGKVKSLLEMGAGMGLTGLLAAHIIPHVVLTDFNPAVLRNCLHNAVLNCNSTALPVGDPPVCATPSPFPADHTVLVRRLDWSRENTRDVQRESPGTSSSGRGEAGVRGSCVRDSHYLADLHPELDGVDRFDVVIGSDMICSREDAEHVARAVSQWLAPSGQAYFMLPPADVRWGVKFFEDAAVACGFQVHRTPVPSDLVQDLIEQQHLAMEQGRGKDSMREAGTPATGGGCYEAQLEIYNLSWA